MAVIKAYKKVGETVVECLERARLENNISKDESMTFAGRLDPAAKGEMIFLTGPDIKNKEKYLHADKVYEVEYLFGISTDTGDLLGLVKEADFSYGQKENDVMHIALSFKSLTGKRKQLFHPFSSKVVDGKPLWQHFREGRVVEASHDVEIYSIEVLEVMQIEYSQVVDKVRMFTQIIKGDFRQEEILKSWNAVNHPNTLLLLMRVNVKASSGTYMRVLGEELSKKLNIPVVAYSIMRTAIIVQ